MKKIVKNKFDILVENLIVEFSKIPNFDLTQTDETANQVFKIISFRMAEITSYKDLVCQSFIPATNKAIFDAKKDFQNSHYKIYLNTKQLDFEETLYETVRLGYVGLFHKLENYINDVIKVSDLIFSSVYETEGSVAKWAKDRFEFDIKNWRQFYITEKINWICNCVKHKDSFPTKEPKPNIFRHLNENEKIRISPNIFKQDCDFLIKFYPMYLQMMFIFAQHKMIFEKALIKEEWENTPDLYEKQIETRNKMEFLVQDFLKMLKD